MVVFSVISIFLGVYVFFRYKKRLKFFTALMWLCEKLEVEISYSKERLEKLFLSLDRSVEPNLLGVDKNYLLYLQKGQILDGATLFKDVDCLKDAEKQDILLFFKNLGRSDSETQTSQIKNFYAVTLNYKQVAETENKKYGKSAIKLAVLGVLFAVVIFV